jgi:hypothetical protein
MENPQVKSKRYKTAMKAISISALMEGVQLFDNHWK